MSASQTAKIDAAIASCLEECRATDRPFSRVAKHIAALRNDPAWTFAEIDELQSRLTRLLVKREGEGGGNK